MNSIIEAQLTLKQFEYNLGTDRFGNILTLNDKICLVHYEDDKGYAIFQCEDKGYIIKDTTLYLLHGDSYIKLLLKLDTIERQFHVEYPSVIKNVI